MSFLDGYSPPTDAELAETNRRVLSAPSRRVPWVEDDGFVRADVDMGTSADDREQADRQADREWDARWPA